MSQPAKKQRADDTATAIQGPAGNAAAAVGQTGNDPEQSGVLGPITQDLLLAEFKTRLGSAELQALRQSSKELRAALDGGRTSLTLQASALAQQISVDRNRGLQAAHRAAAARAAAQGLSASAAATSVPPLPLLWWEDVHELRQWDGRSEVAASYGGVPPGPDGLAVLRRLHALQKQGAAGGPAAADAAAAAQADTQQAPGQPVAAARYSSSVFRALERWPALQSVRFEGAWPAPSLFAQLAQEAAVCGRLPDLDRLLALLKSGLHAKVAEEALSYLAARLAVARQLLLLGVWDAPKAREAALQVLAWIGQAWTFAFGVAHTRLPHMLSRQSYQGALQVSAGGGRVMGHGGAAGAGGRARVAPVAVCMVD